MKKNILRLVLVIFLVQSSASANTCISDTAFPDINCPTKKGYETTLSDVSYINGAYTCRYATTSGNVHTEKRKINCIETMDAQVSQNGNSAAINGDINNDLRSFADAVYPQGASNSNHFTGSTDYANLLDNKKRADKLKNYIDFIKTRRQSGSISLPAIDSHTNYQRTLGSIITATFTLDPEYFIPGFINQNGELELDGNFKSAPLGALNGGGFLAGVKQWFGVQDAGSMQVMDSLSFMDKQVLGYLVYLGIGFKIAYMNIIFLILGMGIFWSFGFYMYKKTAALSEKRDDFQLNKTSWLMGASVAIAFFVAPIINDGPIDNLLRSAIYQDTSNKNIDNNTNWSTPAQEAIRYFMQQGNYFANYLSDYGMHAYLTFVSYKQGIMQNPQKLESSVTAILNESNKRKARLSADIKFYNQVCKNYFSNVDKTAGTIYNAAASLNNTQYTDDKFNVLSDSSIKADRLNQDACLALESSIKNETNAVVATLQSTDKDLAAFEQLYTTDSDAKKNYQRFINTMTYSQNQFGWINAPIVPISYFFFKNADFFAANNSVPSMAGNAKVFGTMVGNYDKNDISKSTVQVIKEDIGDAAKEVVEWSLGLSFWHLIPGFTPIYNTIDKLFGEAYAGNVDVINAINHPKSGAEKFISKIVNAAFDVIPKNQLTWLAEILVDIDSGKKYTSVKFALSGLAMLISAFLLVLIIEAISITIIAVFLAIKITLHMLEILFFFFTAPVIGLFYAMMNNGQSKDFVGTYFKNLAVLAMSPILMTVVTYLIIVVSEFLQFFFLGLIELFVVLVETGTNNLSASADNGTGFVSGFKKEMMLGMINSLAEVFAYFAVIAIATVMIFNFRDWFTKLAGIDSAVNIMKEGGQEVKQATSKLVNPISG